MLHGMRFLVDVVPRDAHDLHQIRLDEAVPGNDPLGHVPAALGEVDQLVLVALDQIVVGHAPQHFAG